MMKDAINRYENSWQGWQAGNQTFSDEELEKVDVREIRELVSED
jgi:hypothetical protein